jgi:hypothetical protein
LFSFVHAQDSTSTATPTGGQPLPESDTAIATRQALRFADSLVKAEFYTDWTTYMALTNPSAIKYYGGKDGFKDHVVTLHFRNEPRPDEKPEKINMISILNDIDTWQCVIEKDREYIDQSRGKVKILTYLVGESTDAGANWKFVDASQNSLENFNVVMPTVFGTLGIPESKTIYVDEVAAQEAAQKEQAAQAAAKKKPVKKSTK